MSSPPCAPARVLEKAPHTPPRSIRAELFAYRGVYPMRPLCYERLMSDLAPARQRDRALVDACIGGSASAWSEIVSGQHDAVRFAIIRTLHVHHCAAPDHLVEDLESALFLKLVVDDFRRLRQYQAQSTLKSWLKVLATNATLDHLRKRRKTQSTDPEHGIDLPDRAPSAHDVLERAQLLERLRGFWTTLPEADAEFVDLFFVRELPFSEIAECLNTTSAALYTRKNRVRKRLLEFAESDGWFNEETG